MGESVHHAPYGKVGGWTTILFILMTGFYGSVFIYGLILPLVFLWPWLFRRLTEVFASAWQTSVVALCEKIHGTKVVVTGDAIKRHEKTVVLMNHRTRLDWMFFFSVVFHSRILNRQKIALKSILKYPPGVGWAMQVAAFIFLDRTWETDQAHINNILSYFVELGSKPNILFFPEGTDLSEKNKEKSKQYAKQKGLPEFEFVLHPRTTGFTCFVNTLRNISGIHAVHDVTVAYPYNIPESEVNLLNGEFPREVHFHIKRYSIDELPKEGTELGKWCQQKWAKKEEMLSQFYSNSDPSLRKFHSNISPPDHPRSLALWLSLILWIVFCVVCNWLLYVYSFARWYCLVICLFYLSVTFLFGEFAKLEMILYDMFKRPRHLWGFKSQTTNSTYETSRNSKKRDVYDKYLNSR